MNTTIVVVVRSGFYPDGTQNNFVLTAYPMRRRRRRYTMQPVRITYDPEGDMLYITFGQPTAATGYQLSDQILLRVDLQSPQAAGLIIRNFSMHVHATHEIPLPGLEEDPEVKPSLMTIVSSPPVTHFLRVVEGKQGMSALLLSPSLHEAVIG